MHVPEWETTTRILCGVYCALLLLFSSSSESEIRAIALEKKKRMHARYDEIGREMCKCGSLYLQYKSAAGANLKSHSKSDSGI